MASLCRFCAKHEEGIDLFSEQGQKKNLYSQVKLCLPINITLNDGMTTFICHTCIKKLNISHEFHSTSLSAQFKLTNHATTGKNTPPNQNTAKPKSPTKECGDTIKLNDSSESDSLVSNCSSVQIESINTISEKDFKNLTESENQTKNIKRPMEKSENEVNVTSKKKERSTVCKHCKKWFPRSIIFQHEKLHVKGSMTFNCTSCNNDFQEEDELKKHTCVSED